MKLTDAANRVLAHVEETEQAQVLVCSPSPTLAKVAMRAVWDATLTRESARSWALFEGYREIRHTSGARIRFWTIVGRASMDGMLPTLVVDHYVPTKAWLDWRRDMERLLAKRGGELLIADEDGDE